MLFLAQCALLCMSAAAWPHKKRLFGLDSSSATALNVGKQMSAAVKASKSTSTTQQPVANDFWQSFKAQGVNLGNWLVIERWMDTVFYDTYASSDSSDEWTLCETLGADACTQVLETHWNEWVTETDIRQVANLGFNLLRIPVGHWALIPTTSDEPYIHGTQMDQVERVMQYASDMGLYVVLDIHGLPGSQNGKEHSGHAGSIDWFTAENQKRSLTAVSAAMSFISNSPNAAVIAGLEICNEPNITTSAHQKTYNTYIKAATSLAHAVNASMPILFHDGFLGPQTFSKLTKNLKDNYVIDIHKYYTDSTINANTAVQEACQLATSQASSKSKTPVFVGEYSVSVGGVFLDTDSWREQFLETQVEQYSGTHLAGSAFWSLKVYDTGSNTTQNNGWSVQALAEAGSISTSTWDAAKAITCPAASQS